MPRGHHDWPVKRVIRPEPVGECVGKFRSLPPRKDRNTDELRQASLRS